MSGHDLFELLFRPILASFMNDYLWFHRHSLNDLMALTIFMTFLPF